ncbi:MAG: hypothetical protein QW717_08010 [Candidatus Bathyarchaeia archaeon]
MQNQLEKEIIRVLKYMPDYSGRWSQIRNALLIRFQPQDLNNFNVQLTRALEKLEKGKIITKAAQSHKNVVYKLNLSEINMEEDDIRVIPLFAGAFNPEKPMPTFKQFKSKVLDLFEDSWLKVEYEKFVKEWKYFQKLREKP